MDDRLIAMREMIATNADPRPFEGAYLYVSKAGSTSFEQPFDSSGLALSNPMRTDADDNFPDFTCRGPVGIRATRIDHWGLFIVDPWNTE